MKINFVKALSIVGFVVSTVGAGVTAIATQKQMDATIAKKVAEATAEQVIK